SLDQLEVIKLFELRLGKDLAADGQRLSIGLVSVSLKACTNRCLLTKHQWPPVERHSLGVDETIQVVRRLIDIHLVYQNTQSSFRVLEVIDQAFQNGVMTVSHDWVYRLRGLGKISVASG